MTIRALVIGLTLGLLVSLGTHYNDIVMGQAAQINHLLPPSMLETFILLLLAVNPLLSLLDERLPLRGKELATITAIGLAACTWPGAGFFRTAILNLAMPAHKLPHESAWQGQQVMSYVPGGSGDLTPGFIRDWDGLLKRLATRSGEGAPAADRPLAVLSRHLETSALERTRSAAAAGTPDPTQKQRLVRDINRALENPGLEPALGGEPLPAKAPRSQVVRANRALPADAIPEHFLPQPGGEGVLFAGGQPEPGVLQPLISGEPKLTLTQAPWAAWWPAIRLWAPLVLLLGLATLFMVVIVHPQWSHHERLAFPIARVLREVSAHDAGGGLPRVAKNWAFWLAFGAIPLLHLLDGSHAWSDIVPGIPMRYNFMAIGELAPTARTLPQFGAYFWPVIFPSIIAFALFLPGSVSTSLRLAPAFFLILALVLGGWGITLNNEYLGASNGNMLRFGAYVVMAGAILYAGRAYYLRTLKRMFGASGAGQGAQAAPWAGWGLLLTGLGAVLVLTQAGLSFGLALAAVLLVLLKFLVSARLVAEAGFFFPQAQWMPVGVLTAMLGFEAMGPTGYIVLLLFSTMLVGDTRTLLAGNLINGFDFLDKLGVSPRRLAPWLAVMILVGFVVAGVDTL